MHDSTITCPLPISMTSRSPANIEVYVGEMLKQGKEFQLYKLQKLDELTNRLFDIYTLEKLAHNVEKCRVDSINNEILDSTRPCDEEKAIRDSIKKMLRVEFAEFLEVMEHDALLKIIDKKSSQNAIFRNRMVRIMRRYVIPKRQILSESVLILYLLFMIYFLICCFSCVCKIEEDSD